MRLHSPTRRLPLHPRPLPHEALSSWVDRLAQAYGMERERFLRLAFDADPPPSAGALDAGGALPGLVAALAERTGIPSVRVRGMTLASYAPGLTGPTEPPRSWLPWRAGDLLDDSPRCCPRCLVTDAIPYVRIHWRLAWMASCPLHRELLVPLDVLPSMVQYIRDRRPERAAPDLVALDRITLDAATTGTALLPRSGSVPGGAWLRALRTLLDEVVRPMRLLEQWAYDELRVAWARAGGAFGNRQGFRRLPFEALPPDRRPVLLQVAGVVVRREAALLSGKGAETMLRAYVMQWSADPVCGALPT